MPIELVFARQERPAGLSTLEQVRALQEQAVSAASTAATNAVAEAMPRIETAISEAAGQAATQAAAGVAPEAAAQVLAQVEPTIQHVAQAVVSVTPQRYGAPANGVDDDAPAVIAALAEHDDVYLPPGTYRFGSVIALASGKALWSDPGKAVVAIPAAAFTMSGAIEARLRGLALVGPHSGTSYQIVLTDCIDCEVDVSLHNGNSGVNLIRSTGCRVVLAASELRATGIRLTGASRNYVALLGGRNIGGFGVYLSLDGVMPSTDNEIIAEKYADAATLTAYQASGADGSAFYNSATGRIGLESLGITVGNNRNKILRVKALDTKDNGVSITSDYNTGGNITASNCDNDGLHLYGSYNALAGVVSVRNAQSGIAASRSETTGGEKFNCVTGAVVDENGYYGVRFSNDATENLIVASVGPSNALGALRDDSTGQNRLSLPGAVQTTDATPQITFATAGDLSPGYGERVARFRVEDGWCDLYLRVRFTPTYSTASGEFRIAIPGLPGGFGNPALAVSDVSGATVWPAGATQLAARLENGAIFRIRAFGPGVAATSLTTANLPSGVQHIFSITGRFRLA